MRCGVTEFFDIVCGMCIIRGLAWTGAVYRCLYRGEIHGVGFGQNELSRHTSLLSPTRVRDEMRSY